MLTEGWDANTATHILGVRAFGTQLPCAQEKRFLIYENRGDSIAAIAPSTSTRSTVAGAA